MNEHIQGQDYARRAAISGAIIEIFRGSGVDFDPTHILPDGKTDTPRAAAERLLRSGVLSECATKQLGTLGIEV